MLHNFLLLHTQHITSQETPATDASGRITKAAQIPDKPTYNCAQKTSSALKEPQSATEPACATLHKASCKRLQQHK
jgi:hypothetical protein